MKGEFHFTSNGVRYFTISAGKLFHIRRSRIFHFFPPRVLKNTKNCAIINSKSGGDMRRRSDKEIKKEFNIFLILGIIAILFSIFMDVPYHFLLDFLSYRCCFFICIPWANHKKSKIAS